MAARSRLVAATTRTSACSVSVPPRGSYCRSCSTRISFTCIAGERSPTSSRKRVPPRARAKRPGVSCLASVKAPRLYPKSSDSSRVSGRAPQLTATKGPFRRVLAACRARAKSSLPVPVGPRISTVLSLSATLGRISRIRWMRLSLLTMSPKVHSWRNSRRSNSMARLSWKVSTTPTTVPLPSRTGDADTLTEMRSPDGRAKSLRRPRTGFFAWSTSRTRRRQSSESSGNRVSSGAPSTSAEAMPVSRSACRLKQPTRKVASTAQTPSESEFRIDLYGSASIWLLIRPLLEVGPGPVR